MYYASGGTKDTKTNRQGTLTIGVPISVALFFQPEPFIPSRV